MTPEPPPRRTPWVTLAVSVLLVAALVAAGVLLSMQTWSGTHLTPLARTILRVELIGGPLPIVVDALAIVALVTLSVRRPTRGRVLSACISVVVGALIAVGVVQLLIATNALGVGLDLTTTIWAMAAFAGVAFAITVLWRSTAWRRLVAALAVIFFVAAGFLGINADFGLQPTVADALGTSTRPTVTLPTVTPQPTASSEPGATLWSSWRPPAGMPTVGSQSQVVIPNTASGFVARPAGLYLPPAALTADPPALPFVIMLMGQPGNPDPSFTATALDAMAAKNRGLAPIVLVADQLGDPAVDTLCLDTAKHGKVETYLTQDVVAWARTHLHVLQDAAHWTIAGYSNGGECALSFGVKYPQLWGNVLDISGEEYPGADQVKGTLAGEFHGDKAAYEAVKPLNLLAGRSYPDTRAVFTVGNDDGFYRAQAMRVFAATTAAGWKTTYFEVLHGGHVGGALTGGLQEGYTVLYPRLGLSEPADQ